MPYLDRYTEVGGTLRNYGALGLTEGVVDTGGNWVSDAFVWTGTRDPVAGWC